MEVTFTLHWWHIPSLITVVSVSWALCYDDGSGFLSGIGNILRLVPALGVSLIAWIIAAICK